MAAGKLVQPQRHADRVKGQEKCWMMQGMHDICLHIRYDNERLSDLEKRQDADHDEMLDMRQYGFVTDRTKAAQRAGDSCACAKHTIGEHETWVVENESQRAVMAPPPTLLENDWVADTLVAVRPENTDRWQLATIRRLSRFA